jgi:hypothetical protein
MKFLRQCIDIVDGRDVIFKLHPAEDFDRAFSEIRLVFPQALVFHHGNVNHMIANADVVITQ